METILRLWDDRRSTPSKAKRHLRRLQSGIRTGSGRCTSSSSGTFILSLPGPPVVPRAQPDEGRIANPSGTVGRFANPSYDGRPPQGGTIKSVGQVANLPEMRQIGNLPHDVRGTSLSEGSASVRLDASGNAEDSSDATGLPGGSSPSLLHSEPRALPLSLRFRLPRPPRVQSAHSVPLRGFCIVFALEEWVSYGDRQGSAEE